jgi:hypothetical protein
LSNVTTSGTTSYPGAIDTRTALVDGPSGDEIVANHPNGLGAAVIAVETELGTDPAGSATDVKTRLDTSQNASGTIKRTGAAWGVTITDNQILIGDTASNAFEIDTLTEGAGIDITRAAGVVTITSLSSNGHLLALVQGMPAH